MNFHQCLNVSSLSRPNHSNRKESCSRHLEIKWEEISKNRRITKFPLWIKQLVHMDVLRLLVTVEVVPEIRKHLTFYIWKKTFHILPPIKGEKYLQVSVIVVPERKERFEWQINLWELPPIADKVLLAENGSVWTEKPSVSSFRLAHVEHLVAKTSQELQVLFTVTLVR